MFEHPHLRFAVARDRQLGLVEDAAARIRRTPRRRGRGAEPTRREPRTTSWL